MNILFVDHETHLKTHSADFFLDILRESFEVKTFYYKKTYRFSIPDEDVAWADVIILWEFLYNRHYLGVPGKRCIFVPMYDNEWGSKWQWKRIAASGMPVISFCDAISRHAKKHGVRNILDLRYFPNPDELPQECGERKRVFLWERGEITLSAAESILPPSEGYTFDVKKADEFIPKDEYLNRLAKCEVVVAPRMKEGIGMAFLEAMAMGKCVVANDDATMNEYIEDGKTGILRNFRKPGDPISTEAISNACTNARTAATMAYAKWVQARKKINPFIEDAAKLQPLSIGSAKDMLQHACYLFEGLSQRIREQITT
jgi:hypothetical protein